MRIFHQLVIAILVAFAVPAASPALAALMNQGTGQHWAPAAVTDNAAGQAQKEGGAFRSRRGMSSVSSKPRPMAKRSTKGKSRAARRPKARRNGRAARAKRVKEA